VPRVPNETWAAKLAMADIKLGEKKRLIADFLTRCNDYADAKIAEYVDLAPRLHGSDALQNSDKINHWHAYKAFNEHALRELADTTLDHWFE
jgi:hypothetical protein